MGDRPHTARTALNENSVPRTETATGSTAQASLRRDLALVAGLTLIAAALRVWGIGWGLPNADRLCSYHPDEGVNLINGVLDRGVLRPHLDIGFYNYGSFYFLLWQVAGAVNSVYGLIGLPPASAPNAPLSESLASLTLVGRMLSVAMAAGTVFVLCWMVRSVWGMRAALAAGLMQTFAPLSVVHSRFATVDATATFIVALALYASVRLLRVPTARAAFMAGALSGLAAATRYNAGLVVLSALTAALLTRSAQGQQAKGSAVRLALLVLVGCVAGFLAGCPGALLNWERFTADLAFEARKSAQGMGLLFEQTGNGWVYHWISSLRHSLGWPLLLLATVCVGLAVRRRQPEDIVLMAFAVSYYGIMGAAQVRFMRYMMPLLPVLFAWTGAALAGPLTRPNAGLSVVKHRVLWGLTCLAVLWAAAVSVAFSLRMAQPDARDLALAHIRESLPAGGSMAFATTPWYWSPPILPEFTAPVPGSVRRRMILESASHYRLRLPGEDREWDLSVFTDPGPDMVVLSDLETQDAVRIGHAAAKTFLATVDERYRGIAFGGRPSLLGRQMVGDGHLPVDFLYVCPTITVYVPRDSKHEHP